jgi:hypothetical protein
VLKWKDADRYITKVDMSKAKHKPTIFAYGFDAAGFVIPSDPLETAKYVVRFIGYRAEQSLDEADGIIMPSGIFEQFKTSNSYYDSHTYVTCDKDHLAKREKEAFQNFKRGGRTYYLSLFNVSLDQSAANQFTVKV